MSLALEGESPVPYRIGVIADGLAGVDQTLGAMVAIVHEYRRSPTVRMLAQSLTAPCASRDARCEMMTLHAYVRDTIAYRGDVRDVETLQTPDYTLEMGSGDCDDHATLLASLAESIGYETRFCAQSIGSGAICHVTAQVHLARGWVNLETTVTQLRDDWNGYPRGAPMPIGWFPQEAICRRIMRVP